MHGIGVRSYSELRGEGASRRDIEHAVASGAVSRIARGWYAFPGAHPEVVKAIQHGARTGCLAGCQLHGLWVPPYTGLHAVYGAGCAPSLRDPDLHSYRAPQPRVPVWPLLDCLEQVVQRHSTETAVIVLESALNLRAVSDEEVSLLLHRHVVRGALVRRHLSSAESGSETRVRVFLQRRNVPVRPQVEIDGVGRVDLLVGRSLIIECDSLAHHSAKDRYELDRFRDLNARDLGFDTARLSYRQVWQQWGWTRAVLGRQIRLGQHSRPIFS